MVSIEVRNRFQALTELEEENADLMNNRMENIYVGAAKPWLRGGTWKTVEERRQLKLAEVRKYTFRKSQEKNKRTVQGKRPRS